MAKRSFLQPTTESRTGGWDALTASVDDLVRRRPETTQYLQNEQVQPALHERVDRGVCAVPVYRIALGDHPEPPFERWLQRQRPEPAEQKPDDLTQPVELYKVGETYFVRDGNRRIAAARSRSQLFMRAHVVEYTTNAPARAADVLRLLITHERNTFFAALPFPPAHPAHGVTARSLGTFDQLAAHIDSVRPTIERLGFHDESALLVAWYDRIYLPIARLIRRRHLLHHFPACAELDLFLWAMNRDNERVAPQGLGERIHQAKYSLASLWFALQTQNTGTSV